MNSQSSPPKKEDVTQWLTEHGDVLFRFALKRLGSREIAEDLVQDTFLAALRSLDDFQGRSAVQTWLVGILRHKIVDHLRNVSRQRERDAATTTERTTSPFHRGHWQVGLKSWPSDPASSLENEEFWRALADCQDKLPSKLATAFRLRELDEMPMAEICDVLDISASNLSVRLHRARLLLRDCLDRNWFATRRRLS